MDQGKSHVPHLSAQPIPDSECKLTQSFKAKKLNSPEYVSCQRRAEKTQPAQPASAFFSPFAPCCMSTFQESMECDWLTEDHRGSSSGKLLHLSQLRM